jgi:hypothetical protein
MASNIAGSNLAASYLTGSQQMASNIAASNLTASEFAAYQGSIEAKKIMKSTEIVERIQKINAAKSLKALKENDKNRLKNKIKKGQIKVRQDILARTRRKKKLTKSTEIAKKNNIFN